MQDEIVIATMVAEETDNTERVEVLVVECPVPGHSYFRVYVDGGLLHNGDDDYMCHDLGEALAFAAEEVACVLGGE